MKHDFIVVEGNIGAGKTSLVTTMAHENQAKLVLEQFADNPFLPKFYENPERYSFPLELSFLAERYHQLLNELSGKGLFNKFIIADYYFMKSLIFAQNTLPDDLYKLYRQIFFIIYQSLPKPDLYVYLHRNVDNLMKNIKKRGRDYEQNISPEYLEKIQKGYFDFFRQTPELTFLIIDTNKLDYVNNPEHYKQITEYILEGDYSLGLNRIIPLIW